MRTHDKIRAVAAELTRSDLKAVAPDLAWVTKGAAILRGLGIVPPNLIDYLLPPDPDDADQVLDKLIAFLLELRGDELPPFDPGRYGESIVAELFAVLRSREDGPVVWDGPS